MARVFHYLVCSLILSQIFLFLTVRTVRGVQTKPRIVGGTTTIIKKRPYLVNLHYNGRFFCGGSLVASRYVVTAAHCVYNRKRSQLQVVAGASLLTEQGVRAKVQRIMVPRKFNKKTLNNDVAVLKLATAISGTNISTIPLCSTKWRNRSIMQVSGWGYTRQYAVKPSQRVRTVKVPVISRRRCKQMYFGQGTLTGTMFCAARLGKRDACSGDSGGPAVYKGELCGIVSWGIGCARARYPGVYTDVNKVKRFIVRSMKK